MADPAPLPATRKCLVCGDVFRRTGRQVYCSPTCAAAAQLRQIQEASDRKRKAPKTRPCKICRKPFSSTYGQKRYCSPDCVIAALAKTVRRRKKAAKKK